MIYGILDAFLQIDQIDNGQENNYIDFILIQSIIKCQNRSMLLSLFIKPKTDWRSVLVVIKALILDILE